MLLYLNAFFVGFLILSNIISIKLFDLWGLLFLPAAVIVYAITYPITDVIGEVYGKDAARRTVHAGFTTQIFVSIFLFISIQLPPAPFFESQEAYETILGASFRAIIASLIAYFISHNIDVFIFNKLKDIHGQKKLWLRNNASTMLSQLIDTVLFITIAFYGLIPNQELLSLIFAQYIFKLVVAVIDTPVVYLLVKWCRYREQGVS